VEADQFSCVTHDTKQKKQNTFHVIRNKQYLTQLKVIREQKTSLEQQLLQLDQEEPTPFQELHVVGSIPFLFYLFLDKCF